MLLSYYRLSQTDLDGTAKHLRTVALRCNTQVPLSMYPNPTTGFVKLHVASGLGIITIIDPIEKPVYRGHADGTDGTLDLRGLPHGAYVLIVDSDHGLSTTCLVLTDRTP